MIDISHLTRQVQHNCNISDARYGGCFSVCGLVMRLRDLYKWEKGLSPWVEHDSNLVLQWIGEREALWEDLSLLEPNPVYINGRTFDPYESEAINEALHSSDFFYGAGFAGSLKPTFFVSPVLSSSKIEGFPVLLLGRELARDLLTLPALVQDGIILLREETVETSPL